MPATLENHLRDTNAADVNPQKQVQFRSRISTNINIMLSTLSTTAPSEASHRRTISARSVMKYGMYIIIHSHPLISVNCSLVTSFVIARQKTQKEIREAGNRNPVMCVAPVGAKAIILRTA